MNSKDPQFVIPREEQPSAMRRLLRRTLYLRLLDGEFLLWCFETVRSYREHTDLLSHPRVVVSDPQALSKALRKAVAEVCGSSLFRQRSVLILHCMRAFQDGLAPIETQGLYETCKRVGMQEFFVLLPEQLKELTDSAIVTLCHEVGAFNRHLTKQPTR